MSTSRFASALVVTMACSTLSVMAQSTRATVTGRVLDDKKQPVIGAIITVKNESTGFSVSAPTGVDGSYTIREIPLGSPYTVTARYVGYGDQVRTGYSLNQGDLLRVNFTMTETATELQAVEVVANSLKKNVVNEGASTTVSAQDIQKLPVNGRNFTSLIDLSPLSNGMNLSGQLASSTGFNIDGMSSKNPISGGAANTRKGSPYAMTMEAVREFKVVTNAYDVTYGRAGGGLINAVTKSGTNTLTGGAFTYMRADWLTSPYDILGNKRTSDFSTYQYGFSLGGPIIKDRLHFFVAWDHQQDTKPLRIADIHGTNDEVQYNLSQTTLNRYLDIARNKYGMPDGEVGSFDKKSSTNSIFARIDWQINPTNLLSVRNNLNINSQPYSQGDNTTINMLESYSDCNTADNSLMASLRSVFGPKITNEAKFQWMYSKEETKANGFLPSPTIPRAIVENITSDVNGKTVRTNIQLGGQRFTPENFHDNVYQFVDNLYINAGKIDYTLGVDVMYSHLSSLYGSETNGRYYFTGLDNFEALNPYRYARDIYTVDGDAQRVKERILNAGVYGQLHTQLFDGFDVVAGLRLDNASYLDHGNYNEKVDRLLGVRTDKSIGLLLLQPRLQITWDINNKHTDIVKLGGGIFASDINNYATVNSQVFDGSRIVTIDTQNPAVLATIRPDFPGYRKDPSTAPGQSLLNNPNVEKLVTINANSSDARVPRIYKANLSYTHYFSDRFKMGVSGYMTLARNNYLYIDRNMVDQPYFRLANEDNRGVYVPAESIGANGVADWTKGRKTTELGRVLELNTIGKVNQFAFVIDGSWRYYKDGFLSFSYTWNSVKDNNTYNGDVANTSTLVKMVKDDPRDMSRLDYSNNQFRHKVVVYGTAPTFWGITAGLRFSGIGGTRYSVIVGGNVNGDFVSTNDLAFIFDPNSPSTPADIKKGMEDLMNNPKVEGRVKDYVRDHYGRMAERNGGTNGFYGTFDLHLEKSFKLYKTHAIDVAVDLFNVANMLNKDWGVGKNLSYVPIYAITGFDQQKKQYTYKVNTNAGVAAGNGNPYQFQIGLRYKF